MPDKSPREKTPTLRSVSAGLLTLASMIERGDSVGAMAGHWVGWLRRADDTVKKQIIATATGQQYAPPTPEEDSTAKLATSSAEPPE